MKLTDLECTRQINASPEEVYDVWIDPSCPGGPWFSPQTDGMKSKILFTAKVDGLFYHCVTRGEGTWAHYGRFTQIERGTFVKLVHTGVPDDEKGNGHKMGWQWCLNMLADKMASRK